MSTSAVVVRAAQTQDAAALGRLGALLVSLHHAYDADRFIAPTPETERGYGAFLASEVGRADAIILVAEQVGEVVGYVYAALEGHDWMALRGPAGLVHDLVVAPANRNAGVGRMLLDAALEALAARDAPRVILSTAMRNTGAQRLFAQAGFRATMVEMMRESTKRRD